MGRLAPKQRRRILWIWAAWSASVLVFSSEVARRCRPAFDPWPRELAMQAPPLARWDAGWYYGIAANGYRYDPGETENNVGFYPLYPLVCRWTAAALHITIFHAGITLSFLSLLGALLLFGDLAAQWGDPGDATISVLVLLLYPTAFFLAAVYTESLFLLTTTAAFWAARDRRWLLAGLAGAAVSLTRFNGFLIALPIAWYAWEASGRSLRRVGWRPIAALALTAAGTAAFPIFLWQRWGDPLLYVHSKQKWLLFSKGAQETGVHLRFPGAGGKLMGSLLVGSLLLFAVLTALLFRERLLAEGLYCAGTLLALLNSTALYGIHRYVLVLFPCFFALARFLRSRLVLSALYAVSGAAVGLVLLSRFVRWVFVG